MFKIKNPKLKIQNPVIQNEIASPPRRIAMTKKALSLKFAAAGKSRDIN
jgi:hypothetical protein